MTRSRTAIVIVTMALFVVVGGVLIFANQSHAGGEKVTLAATVTKASSMTPATLTAHLDDEVTISISSDTTGELHLHGYDIPFDCKAGQVISHTFKADKSGRFDIEWESTGTSLGELVVT